MVIAMPASLRYLAAGLTGGAIAYVYLVVAANLEDFQFYAIRSLVTGKSAMSEIVDHLVDRWIVPLLMVATVSFGTLSGVVIARWLRPSVH